MQELMKQIFVIDWTTISRQGNVKLQERERERADSKLFIGNTPPDCRNIPREMNPCHTPALFFIFHFGLAPHIHEVSPRLQWSG